MGAVSERLGDVAGWFKFSKVRKGKNERENAFRRVSR